MMFRVARFLNSRQRAVGVNLLLGSTTLLAYGTYRNQRPLLLDSGSFIDSWNSKPSVQSRPQKGQEIHDVEGDSHDDPVTAWQTATDRVMDFSGSLTGWSLVEWRNKIAGFVMPSWIILLPGWLDKLNNELSMAPWSLSWEIWEEAHDPEINPEIVWDARVRISTDLCKEEQLFLQKRRLQTTKALAKYLDVPEKDVHPDDVPTIAMCGSGGGLRALVAGASSFLSTQEDGLFDCVTYTAGVSGSCWLQTLYFSSIGRQNCHNIIEHLKQRIGVHIGYPPALFSSLAQAPTNKYLLSGFVEKLRGVENADFGLVDVYGMALAARLLVPSAELKVDNYDLKVSNQRFYTDEGKSPLPIYTAVRHEIPEQTAKTSEDDKKNFDWFQWFEWTPYEFFCEELNAGIPTWAVGRKWNAGQTVWRENGLALPELRIPLYLGVWGSAFCATLSHYFKEVRPILLASGMGGLATLIDQRDDDLVKVHPIDPAFIPNFALGLRGSLPPSCPESMYNVEHLQLMDAGMANNLPIYPLLRPGRDVDVIITFDASADVRGDNWIKVVDGYARQRGIKAWPMGAGWPPKTNQDETLAAKSDAAKLTAVQEQSHEKPLESTAPIPLDNGDLGFCTVWAGSTEERDEHMDDKPPHRITDDHTHLLSPHAGITVIYFPLIPNPTVPGVDPLKSEFLSTWNFVYTSDNIDSVVALARANYQEGREQTRRTIRAIWERKRALRLKREAEALDLVRRRRVVSSLTHRRSGDVGHGDQFAGV
ncbi:cytosolic phospholipase A2 zeta [Acrodontium crateriforme]|uniref:Lysophospholipase n=1 Tax=Acrodontium crateriforme TaxID=150365 RepID=A0AAQ3M074_9PEZI|nr:cytosolic phospholipase A2 zeta [Acrodontium crateriforme]